MDGKREETPLEKYPVCAAGRELGQISCWGGNQVPHNDSRQSVLYKSSAHAVPQILVVIDFLEALEITVALHVYIEDGGACKCLWHCTRDDLY